MRPITASAALVLAFLTVPTAAAAVQIVSPTPGTTVQPGANVTVRVVVNPADQITDLAVAMGDQSVVAKPGGPAGTFEATLVVPAPLVGPEFIVAVGSSSTGQRRLDFVAVIVDPGPLRSLRVAAPERLIRVGQVEQLTVHGLFADGITRDLTLPERGTTYATSNDSVLGVHATGLVQARQTGLAEITVTSRGQTGTAVVTVSLPPPPGNTIPVANPGPDQTVAAETVVTLSAAASTDADGDPLRYHWQQESGRIVTLTDTQSVQLKFVAPRIGAPEVLTFSLVVNDSKGATTFPVVVKVTVQP